MSHCDTQDENMRAVRERTVEQKSERAINSNLLHLTARWFFFVPTQQGSSLSLSQDAYKQSVKIEMFLKTQHILHKETMVKANTVKCPSRLCFFMP